MQLTGAELFCNHDRKAFVKPVRNASPSTQVRGLCSSFQVVGFQQELGESHQNTLSAVSYLAQVLLLSQEKSEEAEALFQKALAGQEKQLGESHLETLGTMLGLARLRRKKASPSAEDCWGGLQIQRKLHVAKHADQMKLRVVSFCLRLVCSDLQRVSCYIFSQHFEITCRQHAQRLRIVSFHLHVI